MSAAFDTLDHTTLLHRLEHTFGLSGTVHTWIHSYLTNRSSFVKIDSSSSSYDISSTGVPQGSVLGPLLFVLFISPVVDVIGLIPDIQNESGIVSFHQYSAVHRCKFFNTCSSNSIYRGVHSTSSRLAFEQWSSPQPI